MGLRCLKYPYEGFKCVYVQVYKKCYNKNKQMLLIK